MSFCRNKKALAFQAIIVIILVLFAFTVIVGVVKIITSKTGEAQGIEVCRGNIVVAAKLKEQTKSGLLAPSITSQNLLCKTYDKNLYGKNEEVARMISQLAAKCWYEFGEGRYANVFGDYFLSNDYCFICYTFSTGYSDKSPVKKNDLIVYMSQNIYGNTGKTYLDYIQNYAGEGRIEIDPQLSEFRKGEVYAVALVSPFDWTRFSVKAETKAEMNWIIISELNKITSKTKCEPVKDISGQ